MEWLETPIVRVAAAFVAGVALVVLANTTGDLKDPLRGRVRLTLGGVSFTEIFGIFLIGYAIGALVAGPTADAAGSQPRGGGGFGGRFGFLTRGTATPFSFGFALAFLAFLWRYDILGRLSNPQSHRAIAAIIGTIAEALEDIPAGGLGQIAFRDSNGNRIGIMAASDVAVPRGSFVRIVGTRGLNPLVAPNDRTDRRAQNPSEATSDGRSGA
jgi:hypothetical protein